MFSGSHEDLEEAIGGGEALVGRRQVDQPAAHEEADDAADADAGVITEARHQHDQQHTRWRR